MGEIKDLKEMKCPEQNHLIISHKEYKHRPAGAGGTRNITRACFEGESLPERKQP